MPDVQELYRSKLTNPVEALRSLPRRSLVLLGIFGAQPPALVKALGDQARAGAFEEVRVYYMHATEDTAKSLFQLDLMDVIKLYPFFLDPFDRALMREANKAGDCKVLFFVPNSFSMVPGIIRNQLKPDLFVLHTTTMDRHGWFNFGPTGAYSLAGVESAKRVIVEVDSNLPRCQGTGMVHVSNVDAIVEHAGELPLIFNKEPSDVDKKITDLLLPMIEDGACVQFGVGGVPNLVASSLNDRKDLGVHTELISDGLAGLIESGAVTNRRKTIDPGKSIFQTAFGTAITYDLVTDNPSVECRMADYVNDPRIIGQNDHVVSVNGMIEVDLMGQVNAEFIDTHQFGAAGGQLDFVQGAYYSKGGLSFIVASSAALGGKVSRIVPRLQGPPTDRAWKRQYIVTEHGMFNLRGKSSQERALGLIEIADPAFRDELTAAAHEMHML